MLPGCGSSNFGTLAIVILESEEGKKIPRPVIFNNHQY